MKVTILESTCIDIIESIDHVFHISTRDVAEGYGVDRRIIDNHKRLHADELIEGKHWFKFSTNTAGGNQSTIQWTKRGIVRLGFFIKSERAKQFRDWAENYVIDGAEKHQKPNDNSGYLYQLRRENIELKRAINRISKDTTEKLSPDSAQFLLDLIGQISRWIDESERIEAIERNRREKTQRFLDVFVRTMNHPGITEQSMRKSDVI